jgi:hypothetical protein
MPFLNTFNSGSSKGFGFLKGVVLNPPTGMATVVSETSVSVSFTAPSGDTPSNIEYRLSTNGGSTYGSWIALSPPDITSPITISGLTSNEAYTAQLRTTLLGQFSEPSTSFNFQTLAAAPTGLSASSITTTSFVLSFSQATGGGETISNYKYALSTNGGSSYGAYTALSPADATSPVTISGLSSGTAYVVKIRAVTAAGDGTESAGLSVTTALPEISGVEYLVIAGGGGGGSSGGGERAGGGAGGYKTSVASSTNGGGQALGSTMTLGTGTYAVTVGGGGNGSSAPTAGASSVFNGITSTGGGVGGNGGTNPGGSAGSFGYGGGSSINNSAGGGGGGSGSAGGNASSGVAGNGGSGLSNSITGSSVARGGGGGGSSPTGVSGSGGSGGGGAAYTSGTVNTGGGGGGGGGAGGSGIVIVRYLTSSASGLTVTGGTKTTSGSYTIHTFTSSGSLVIA